MNYCAGPIQSLAVFEQFTLKTEGLPMIKRKNVEKEPTLDKKNVEPYFVRTVQITVECGN